MGVCKHSEAHLALQSVYMHKDKLEEAWREFEMPTWCLDGASGPVMEHAVKVRKCGCSVDLPTS